MYLNGELRWAEILWKMLIGKTCTGNGVNVLRQALRQILRRETHVHGHIRPFCLKNIFKFGKILFC